MKISLIAAVGSKGEIGFENSIPWRQREDMRRFKTRTLGKIVVMGRKTFQSLPMFLDDRCTVVLTKNFEVVQQHVNYLKEKHNVEQPPTIICLSSIEELFNSLEEICLGYGYSEDEIMVAGGAQTYKLFLEFADEVELTVVHTPEGIKADAHFPKIMDMENWRTNKSQKYEADDKNQYDYTFMTLSRDNSSNVIDFKSRQKLSRKDKILLALEQDRLNNLVNKIAI